MFIGVRVVDLGGMPISGVTVEFTVASGEGAVSPSSAVSESSGVAHTFWTPGPQRGKQELVASAGSKTLTLSVEVSGGDFASMRVVSGANTEAPVGWSLPEPVVVEVTDLFGDPVAGVHFGFAVQSGGGVTTPDTATSGEDGLVTTNWTLGPDDGAHVLLVSATQDNTTATTEVRATAFKGIRIRNEPPVMYSKRSTSTALDAWGGQAGTYAWRVSEGSLPTGLVLSGEGVLSGTPTAVGDFPLTVAVQDAAGEHGTWTGTLVVCDSEPIDLALAETAVRTFPDPCGLVLSDAGGAVYRLGLMARGRDPNAYAEVAGGFLIRGRRFSPEDVALIRGVPAQPVHAQAVPPTRTLRARSVPTRAPALVTNVPDVVGPDPFILFPERVRRLQRDTRSVARVTAADDLPVRRTFHLPAAQGKTVDVTATLREVSPHLAFYEDLDNVADGGKHLTDEEIRLALDRYERFGQPVIDEVFGGFGPEGTVGLFKDAEGNVVQVPPGDIDGNGRVLLVQVRPSLMGAAVGFVSRCDRLPRPEHAADTVVSCAQSNEGEIVYHRSGSPYTYIHEIRHIASHGRYLFDVDAAQRSSWVEEGTAVMASEMLSRRAAGIAPGQRVSAADVYVDAGLPSWETYYLWVAPLNGYGYLAASPLSGLISTPSPNPNRASIYGSGWLFHQYLVDRFADGDPTPFLLQLLENGGGVDDTGNRVGVPWPDLLTDFMSAILVEDVPEARALTDNRFVSYDFEDIIDSEQRPEYQEGHWPALQADEPFGDFDWKIETWRTAANLFQLSADGEGPLLVEVLSGDGGPVDAEEDAGFVVVRVR